MPRTRLIRRPKPMTVPARRLLCAAVGALILAAGASPSAAGPAPDETCRGAAPQAQAVLKGPVLHIPDGQTLCVAQGFTPDTWVPLRLADAAQGAARETLMAVAFGKDVACTVDAAGSATCRIEGRSIAELAKTPELVLAGKTWREAGGAHLQARR